MFIKILAIVFCAGIMAQPVAESSTSLQSLSNDLKDLVKSTSPAIVEIRSQHVPGGTNVLQSIPDLPESIKGLESLKAEGFAALESVGSGFIIDPDGYILTTNDVVENAQKITVKLSDGSKLDAKLLGSDPATGVAMIKVDKTNLPSVELGDSDDLAPGSIVVSVSNLAGMENSASLGIVAGTDRKAGGWNGLIQISGTTGPGASGGPVIDPSGKVVGMSAAMFSPTAACLPFNMPAVIMTPDVTSEDAEKVIGSITDSQGVKLPDEVIEQIKKAIQSALTEGPPPGSMPWQFSSGADPRMAEMFRAMSASALMTGNSGFAIPVNDIKAILNDLKTGKTMARGFLGLAINDVEDRIVLMPSAGGPAAKAGIKPFDVLKKANGIAYPNAQEFVRTISQLKAGDKVDLEVERNGEVVNVTIVLSERPTGPILPAMIPMTPDFSQGFSNESTNTEIYIVDGDINQVAEIISSRFGKKVGVIKADKIKKGVTLHVQGTTIEEALKATCKAFDCTYYKDGRDYVIKPK